MARAELLGHLRARSALLASVVVVLLAVALAPRLPEPTTQLLAEKLSAGLGAEVDPDSLVWSRSQGPLRDLIGRDLLFLGRSDGRMGVFRARVSVSPGGRPWLVRSLRRVSESELADVEGLRLREGWAAWALRHEGRVVALEAAPLASLGLDPGAERLVVVVPEAVVAPRWELGAGRLRVALGARTVDVSLTDGSVRPHGALEVLAVAELGGLEHERDAAERASFDDGVEFGERSTRPDAPLRLDAPDGYAEDARFPALLQGAPPPVLVRRSGEGVAYHFDARQIQWRLLPGRRAPRSSTGARAPHWSMESIVAQGAVAVVGWEPPLRGPGSASYSFAGVKYGESSGGWPALRIGSDGAIVAMAPADSSGLGEPLDSWAPLLGRRAEASWIGACLTRAGHWVIAQGEGPDVDSRGLLPAECSEIVRLRSPLSVSSPGELGERHDGPVLVALPRRFLPDVAPPRGAGWRVRDAGASSPRWAPSVHAALGVSRLGTEVELTWLDPTRFDWALVAGSRERPARGGASWPSGLAGDRSSPLLALGLGSGLRRKPRGLRIDGLTGLPFRAGEALLLVGEGGLELLPSRAGLEESSRHAVELRLTSERGELLAAARERGPRQRRADLCVTAGGGLLVAESLFDSHEANVAVLLEMGCKRSASADRGTEAATALRAGDEAAGPYERTTLLAIDRPLGTRGRLPSKHGVNTDTDVLKTSE